MASKAPGWIRCPACGERARAMKTKQDGTMQGVRLRTGALLYQCSTDPADCSLPLGVFNVYLDDAGVVYEAGAMDERLAKFNEHARVVEAAIRDVRDNPLGARGPIALLTMGLAHLERAAGDLIREIP